MILLVVARGFPRCKPNRIPDKMLENKMSENGKPDKMPDNLTGTLTLYMHSLSLYTLPLFQNILLPSLCTQFHLSLSLSLSFSLHSPSLS